MTVSTEVTRVIVEGNGVATVFSYSFPIPGSSATDQTNAELTLLAPDGTITDLADNLWSITGVQGTSGTFTYNPGSPLTTGNFLTLNRIVPYLQGTTLSAQGAYSPEVVEAALDNLAFQTEQLNTVALQSLRAPITDAALNDLPTEVLRANRYLAFDTNGQATVSGVLNTASGFLVVETQSSNTLAPASVLNFVNAVTAVETVSGRVDITIAGAAAGTSGQYQINSSGSLAGVTFSGDATASTSGVITVTASHFASPLPIAQGGTATNSAGLIQGSNITITGTWPNQTIASSAGSGGGLVHLQRSTASNSATLDFTTGIGSTFDRYLLLLTDLVPQTDSTDVHILFGNGGGPTWDTSSVYDNIYLSQVTSAPSPSGAASNGQAAFVPITINSGSTDFFNAEIQFANANGARFKSIAMEGQQENGTTMTEMRFSGAYRNTASVTGIRVLMASGNIVSGAGDLYGYAKA